MLGEMPQRIIPMLARSAAMPPESGGFAFEIKWDGIRAISFLNSGHGGEIRLQSRNLLELTSQYPEIHALAGTLGARQAILDGEIVALAPNGLPSFERLQNRMGVTLDMLVRKRVATYPVVYMIFDLLYFNGASLLNLPYSERRKELENLKLVGPHWQTPAYHIGDGEDILEGSRRMRLEGIVAKRMDSTYEPGRRTGAWLKIKHRCAQDLVIGGWLPGVGARTGRIGALMMGYYDMTPQQAAAAHTRQNLIFAGKAGTGFTEATLNKLAELMAPLERPENPFAAGFPGYKKAVFVEPNLVARFEFGEWTSQGILRQPSYKGLRVDKNSNEIVREDAV